ncbi:methyltransferase-like protein [Coniochaeta ligniaria NRRL 30616]|uniref:Methyltransferase-like protein n=1 Tax=Coniochaeta ligniaria NRRL 30616 TaxID=1408157 RepID=A0A1J7ILB0_9PEZI|nr:methyltransferase-like protein [Coniochaeta ligniaria NRRL 30616]
MATFARSTFSHSGYAAFRPSYPPSLFRTVLAYHNNTNPSSSPGTLLDLGCGHGLIARALAPHFSRIVALDPSAGMVAQAQRLTAPELASKITFRQGAAEDLRPFASDASVDCVVAGQAAHWFDYTKAWPELARVVRKGGTLAFWGYKDHVIVGAGPKVAEIFYRYTYGEGEACAGMESLARFWELPGRDILRESYRAIEPPAAEWGDVRRIAWDPDRKTGGLGESPPEEAMWQRKTLKLGELEGYVRTYSSFKNWQEAYPDLKSRADGGEGDVVDRMFDEVVDAVPEWKQVGEKWRDVEVDVAWGTVILLARRR